MKTIWVTMPYRALSVEAAFYNLFRSHTGNISKKMSILNSIHRVRDAPRLGPCREYNARRGTPRISLRPSPPLPHPPPSLV